MNGTIVVGVDGSPGSEAALRWALEEAKLRRASLTAVHAWSYPYLADLSFMAAANVDRSALETDAKAVLSEAVQKVAADYPGVTISESVLEGAASQVLTEAAHDAELLVVGTRGRGGFAGLLLGSVSQQCAHYARCPVVIIPQAAEPHDSARHPGSRGAVVRSIRRDGR